MTADTSWYGQQTLVHPDYSHQPYAPYGAYETHGTYGDPYAAQGVPWPDYYQAQYGPTLVAEYADHPGYFGHAGHSAYQCYDAQQGYAAYPDYGTYGAVNDASFTATLDAGEDEVAPAPVAEDRDALEGDGDGGRTRVRGSRRRGVRRRSAVLTIAVPSIAVLGVAGAAAVTIGPLSAHRHTTTEASASSSAVAAQAKAQALAASEARDAAQRAARDKARTALQLREAAARKAAAEAPRYTLPIAYHTGLSALFGQAGTHWMQLHTGIDFPVPEGTPVHAVTGGTVTTEWNPYYGYMVKLTAPDGTVTWYCHLSSYRVRSGHVKVGDMIAYSGDTGNSTGPHLHFEVHPDGGPAVDPLPWLLARGLDPR